MVGKVTAQIITSDPLGNSSADRAKSPADEPELVKMPYRTPRNLAASCSNLVPSSADCQFLSFIDLSIDFIMAFRSSFPQTAPP